MTDGRPRIFVVAGEPSGDQHAAMLGAALLARRDVELAGVGQRLMREAGYDLLLDSSGWSAIGVGESLRRVPMLMSRMRSVVRHLLTSPPDLLVLVDFGAFNVRLARRLRRLGAPRTLYYFPPRSWSRQANYAGLTGLVDRVATPFAWSAERLRTAGIDTAWVGHPVVDRIEPLDEPGRLELRRELGIDPKLAVLGLLPGSRPMEIAHIGPCLLDAARIITSELADTQFVLSVAPSVDASLLRSQVAEVGLQDEVRLVEGVADIVRCADVVVTASGTATLEAAAALCPMIVVYRGTPLMAAEKWLRRFRPDHVGMPNIVADADVVPELIHRDATALNVARTVMNLLANAGELEAMRGRLGKVRAQLGEPGVSGRVAEMALDMIGS